MSSLFLLFSYGVYINYKLAYRKQITTKIQGELSNYEFKVSRTYKSAYKRVSFRLYLKNFPSVYSIATPDYKAFNRQGFENEVFVGDFIVLQLDKDKRVLNIQKGFKTYVDLSKLKYSRKQEMIIAFILALIAACALRHHHEKNWIRGV